MPQITQDKRFEIHHLAFTIVMVILVLGAVPAAAAEDRWPVLRACVLGLFAALAIAGLVYFIWMRWFYRCPQCGAFLRPTPRAEARISHVNYHCERCDVIWDSGTDWGD